MAALDAFSSNDLKILRKIVKRIHGMYMPDLKMEDQQADMMIEALTPETVEKYLEYGRHKRVLDDGRR